MQYYLEADPVFYIYQDWNYKRNGLQRSVHSAQGMEQPRNPDHNKCRSGTAISVQQETPRLQAQSKKGDGLGRNFQNIKKQNG